MINPNRDDFTQGENSGDLMGAGEEEMFGGAQGEPPGQTRKLSNPSGDAWEQTKDRVNVARQRTEFFLRENPVPTIIGALGIGLAIGLAIRFASSSEEKETEIETPLGNLNWSLFSLPFLWPFFKTVKRKYESSAETVRDGVDRLKDVDVRRYTKPMRKRWKAWVD